MINQPINQTVIFLKECDLVLTSDTWDVLVKFDLSPYEEAIAILHDELKGINNVTRHPLQFIIIIIIIFIQLQMGCHPVAVL